MTIGGQVYSGVQFRRMSSIMVGSHGSGSSLVIVIRRPGNWAVALI